MASRTGTCYTTGHSSSLLQNNHSVSGCQNKYILVRTQVLQLCISWDSVLVVQQHVILPLGNIVTENILLTVLRPCLFVTAVLQNDVFVCYGIRSIAKKANTSWEKRQVNMGYVASNWINTADEKSPINQSCLHYPRDI